MQDKKPDWNIWLRMRSVSAPEAIALTYNFDPRALALNRSKPDGYLDRLMLCRAVLGAKVTPARLSEWAQSKPVDWSIPIELASLAPVEAPTPEPAPADAVRAALEAVAMPGSDLDEVRREFELAGARFVMGDSGPVLWISDGMTKGRSRPLSVPRALRGVSSFALDRLLRGSMASGGGARPSPPSPVRAWVAPPENAEPAPAVVVPESEQADTQASPVVTVSASAAAVSVVPVAEPNSSTEEPIKPIKPVPTAPSPPTWKMRIQIEAADYWRTLRKSGANPTVKSILPRMVKWCQDNDVKTDGRINPREGYLRTHVLAGKHWTPPAC